jgi:hypothetical protein
MSMTVDFAEDFCAACAKEGEPYLLIYQTPRGASVRWSTENWDRGGEISGEGTLEEDMIAAIKSAIKAATMDNE